jgi:hypothetical protein
VFAARRLPPKRWQAPAKPLASYPGHFGGEGERAQRPEVGQFSVG